MEDNFNTPHCRRDYHSLWQYILPTYLNYTLRKADWDLKRDSAKKLEKLEKRTKRAMAEIIRAKIKCKLTHRGLIIYLFLPFLVQFSPFLLAVKQTSCFQLSKILAPLQQRSKMMGQMIVMVEQLKI